MNLEEKFGGLQQISQASIWVDSNNLVDIPTNNGKFTWNNKRKDFTYIAERLDRFLIKGALSDFIFNIHSSILPIAGSDHYPIQIILPEPNKLYRNPFKCEKMWFLVSQCIESIKQ